MNNRNPLIAARVYRGLTQHELAEEIGKSQSWLSLVESGLLDPDRSIAKEIGAALRVDYKSIFSEFSLSAGPLVLP